jgi:hypothetical protein
MFLLVHNKLPFIVSVIFSLATQTLPCPPGQWKCARGACIDENRRCDLTDDCGDNSDESEVDCGTFW